MRLIHINATRWRQSLQTWKAGRRSWLLGLPCQPDLFVTFARAFTFAQIFVGIEGAFLDLFSGNPGVHLLGMSGLFIHRPFAETGKLL